jgi:glutamate synthase (NADPH/NADH) large chain
MNRIGGKSNTGEGGEDPARYRNELKGIPIQQGDTLKSVIGEANVEVDLSLNAWRFAALEDQAGRVGPLRRHGRIPAVRPTRSRSRWRRAPSPAKAASCPGGKVTEYIGKQRYCGAGRGAHQPAAAP